MPTIAPQILELARVARCNVFIESGTLRGHSFRRALRSGIFKRCYTVEIVPALYRAAAARYPARPSRQAFLGKSHEVFRKQIFPLCSAEDRIFFWLDGHYSAGPSGGADAPCPLLKELEAIRRWCPSRSLVIVIDDTNDFGMKNPGVPGLNWPTRAAAEAAVHRINPNFICLDYTGKGPLQKIFRGVLVFSYCTPKESA